MEVRVKNRTFFITIYTTMITKKRILPMNLVVDLQWLTLKKRTDKQKYS
jgi:hypothetical protein